MKSHLVIGIILGFSFSALGQYNYDSEIRFAQEKRDIDSENKWKIELSGLLEGRLVHHDRFISWQDTDEVAGAPGGGQLQYGARYYRMDDPQRGSRVTISNATAIVSIRSDKGYFGSLQLTADDSDTVGGTLKLPQAEVGRNFELSENMSLTTRIALLVPNISPEHVNPGWTTAYTLTPSSFNTWIGEEGQVSSFENLFRHEFSTSQYWFRLGVFTGGDTMGILLRNRLFAQHNYIGAQGTLYPVSGGVGGGAQGVTDRQEINGDLGSYWNLGYEYDSKYAINLWRWQNDGDNRTQNGGTSSGILDTEWAWRTFINAVDLKISPMESIDILLQSTTGSTERGGPNDSNAQEAAFATNFVTLRFNRGSDHLAYRYETFQVTNPLSDDDLLQKGFTHTVSYTHDLSFAERLGFEWVSRSNHKIDTNGEAIDDDFVTEELGQIFYRIYF